MSRLNTIARAAQRRRRLRRTLRSAGSALWWASVVEVLLVVADRAMGLGLGWVALAAPPAGLVLSVLAVSALRRDTLISAAHEVDTTLGLGDRLASGLAFGSAANRDVFEELALTDAEHTAERVRAAQGVRLDASGSHRWWPAAAAVAVALAVWLPARTPRLPGAAPLASTAAERDEARDDITHAAEHLRDTLEAKPELFEEATSRQLEALEALQDELERPGTDADEARAKAADTLSKTADSLRDEAQQTERTLDATSRSIAPGSGDPIADALRRGDFDTAADQLNAMREGATSEEDRRAIAERLDRLADLVSTPPSADDSTNADARTLSEQGIDPDRARQLAEQGDAQAIRDELRSLGQDPIDAESIADAVRDHAREREAQRRASERARDLSQALRDAAQEARDQSDTQAGDAASDPGDPQDADQTRGEAQTGEPRPGSDQGQGQASESSPDGSSPQSQGDGARSDGQDNARRGPSQSPAQGGDPSALGRAERLARGMSQDRARSRELRSAADEIDRSAGNTAPSATGGPLAGTRPGSSRGPVAPRQTTPDAPNTNLRTEAVDARPRTDSTRTIAEVEALGPARPGRPVTTASAQQALREAAPGAERAIENQGVPARFRDLVRRYFRPAPRPPAPQDGS